MSESNEILTMRDMAWERAKGELHGYLRTFWPEYTMSGAKIDNGFEDAHKRIHSFIKEFEDNK